MLVTAVRESVLKTAITPLALLAPTLRGLVPMCEKSGASGDPAGAQRDSADKGPVPPPVPPAGSGCGRSRGHPSSLPARLPSLQVYRAQQPYSSEPQVWSVMEPPGRNSTVAPAGQAVGNCVRA